MSIIGVLYVTIGRTAAMDTLGLTDQLWRLLSCSSVEYINNIHLIYKCDTTVITYEKHLIKI